jgi:hypothetical protein
MPSKLAEGSKTERIQIVAPATWLESIEEWRAKQRPIPNISAAIRQLVEDGLKASAAAKA